MSGHSKWSNIKHKKEAEDSKKGKEFTRLGQNITTAAREFGVDPDSNPALRLAIEKAKAANMPKQNIKKAIERSLGLGLGGNEEVVYEMYGPGGVAVLVKCLTNNKNRTTGQVRSILNRFGVNLGAQHSASYLFPNGSEPSYKIPLKKEDAQVLNNMINALESLEEVQSTNHNADLTRSA